MRPAKYGAISDTNRLRTLLFVGLLAAATMSCEGAVAPEVLSTSDQTGSATPPPARATGAIQVGTVTIGGSLDASFNRYTIRIGRDRVAAVGPNSSALIGGLSEGTYSVELVDLSDCRVLGSNPRNMTVFAKLVTREIFRVHC